jgi:hypothetical protein
MRVAAVVCVIMALTTADEKFTPAYYYREQYPDYAKEVHGDLNRFCKLHHKNFTANGTVATPKHGGRPSNVPHAVAFHASTIFKAGKVVKAYPSADSKRKVMCTCGGLQSKSHVRKMTHCASCALTTTSHPRDC